MQLRKDGRFYQVSPWLLTWDDENYYLVAYDADAGKMKHYRVDKMLDLSAVDQARCGRTDYEQMDIASYSRKKFRHVCRGRDNRTASVRYFHDRCHH